MLPTFLMEGPLTWPGQHTGFLGPRHDPWQIKQDPDRPDFRVESLQLPDGLGVEHLRQRRALFDRMAAPPEDSGSRPDPFAARRELAFSTVFAGAGVQGGRAIGQTDKIGA